MNIQLKPEDYMRVVGSDDLAEIIQNVYRREEKIDKGKEHFWVFGLNVKNMLLFLELVSLGSVTEATVSPMNVFQVALIKNAVKVVFAHNHPSTDLVPSDQDIDITDRLIQVGKILSIQVCDHIITSLDKFETFAGIGLLDKLMESTKWAPGHEQIEKIKEDLREAVTIAEKTSLEMGRQVGIKIGKKEGIEIGFEDGKDEGIVIGKKEEKFEIAKEFLINGAEIDLVVKSTGLSKDVVSKLLKEITKK